MPTYTDQNPGIDPKYLSMPINGENFLIGIDRYWSALGLIEEVLTNIIMF